MKENSIFKFIYFIVLPMIIGAVIFYYVDKMEESIIYKISIWAAIAVPTIMIKNWIYMKIVKGQQTLAEKIMSCDARRKYGDSYCVKCPDGYSCGEEKKV